ncbi:hypothetical protein [Flintibacter muris]|uniref:hypothetical protein n=1 Tax=Flintibacter muris TaxID=2941327 RepID=UPI0020423828|nr:hypothetical protein [Flintibacter muris]
MARRDPEKMRDKLIWERMALEMAALHELIGKIQTDPDYQAVMDCQAWDRLGKMVYYLNNVRSWAERRMARHISDWNTQTFYPHDSGNLESAVAAFRNSVKEAIENK